MTVLEHTADWLDVSEVAQILRVSEKLVYKLLKSNQIRHHKFGRVYRIPALELKRMQSFSNELKEGGTEE